jgi:GNAT superfamily N-acetyltransferase
VTSEARETALAQVRLDVRAYGDPAVQALVAAVQAEYVRRYGGPDAAAVDPAEFDPPDGLFVVAVRGEQVLAMGGWRRVEHDTGVPTAEIKRMYVRPDARRQGLARLVLAELEASAARSGIARIVLNTGTQQPEAIALYESSGYLPSRGFGLYADAPLALFYAKSLIGSGLASPPGDLSRE